MTQFIDLAMEGVLFPLTMDGKMIYESEDSDIFPATFQPQPTPVQNYVDTLDGGSQAFQPGFGPGHPDFATRWMFSIVFASISGPMKVLMAKLLARGMQHELTYWKPEVAAYTASFTTSLFFLPHYRRNAAQVYSGLIFKGMEVTTANFPVLATLDDVALVVDYQDGPVVAPPAAGHVAIGKFPDASGHVEVMVGTPVTRGQVLELIFFPIFLVTMTEFTINFPGANQEQHTYKFQER